jgi:5-methylcytosine-specific restriction endonuclease McrA
MFNQKEYLKAYMKEYKELHPEYVEKNKIYLQTYRTPYMQEYRIENAEKIRLNERIRYAKIREEALQILGGICEECSESELEFLTVDHVNNDGNLDKHHKLVFTDIVKGRSDNSRFQVLCRNCNDGREIQNRTNTGSIDSKTKLKVIQFLGMVCSCCLEQNVFKLTVDHVNNDGNRKDLPRSGRSLYLKILSGKANREEFQLLCWNCNFSKHLGGGVCLHQRRKEQVE